MPRLCYQQQVKALVNDSLTDRRGFVFIVFIVCLCDLNG